MEAGLDEGGMGSVVRWARNGLKAEARTEEPFTVVAGHDPWEQSMERRLYEGRRRPPRRVPLSSFPRISLFPSLCGAPCCSFHVLVFMLVADAWFSAI